MGPSGDADGYAIELEHADVTAVTAALAARKGRPVDVFGHSIGATIALGAAGRGAPIRRLVATTRPVRRRLPPPGWSAAGELQRTLKDAAEVEPLLRRLAHHEVVTTAPLADIVAEVLMIAAKLCPNAAPPPRVTAVTRTPLRDRSTGLQSAANATTD